MKMKLDQRKETRELSSTVIQAERSLNSVLANGEIAYCFRTHYTDTSKELYGISDLITSILKSYGAVHPRGSESSELRNVVISSSLYLYEVEREVRKAFGPHRYPTATIRVYLCGKTPGVQQIQLKGHEDSNRTCPKPRAKYYLADEKHSVASRYYQAV